MYSVECKVCKKSFQKRSNKSTETTCPDCIYKAHWSSSRNAHAAIGNNELSKKQILNKLDRMEKKLKLFDDTIATIVHNEVTVALKDIMREVADKAALEHSQDFIELKTSIEQSQGDHEKRMKTLLATVNTRAIATEKTVKDEITILSKRVTELRRIANTKGWKVTPTKE
tara:strand:- start:357 stop:866 length:510 start_codon:yes stop_codon:yes gene_type:complete